MGSTLLLIERLRLIPYTCGSSAVFSRIVMVLFLCRNESSRNVLKIYEDFFWNKTKICAHRSIGGGVPVGHKPTGRGHPLWPRHAGLWGPRGTTAPISALYLPFRLKKIREKVSSRFTIRRRHHLLFFIWRADLESVLGSGEGKSSSSLSTFLHR